MQGYTYFSYCFFPGRFKRVITIYVLSKNTKTKNKKRKKKKKKKKKKKRKNLLIFFFFFFFFFFFQLKKSLYMYIAWAAKQDIRI